MKHPFLLKSFVLFFFLCLPYFLVAQITITDDTCIGDPVILTQTGTQNGKPFYSCNGCVDGGNDMEVGWDGSQWRIDDIDMSLLWGASSEDVATPCDVSSWSGGCSPFNVTGCASVSSTDVPTLSEWGLINLAILLLTFGTIYLINPNFSLQKKRID